MIFFMVLPFLVFIFLSGTLKFAEQAIIQGGLLCNIRAHLQFKGDDTSEVSDQETIQE